MRWIFYIACFLLLGINSASAYKLPSQQISRETFCANHINQNYILSPDQLISEDLDTEYSALGSGIVVSNHLPAYFSEQETIADTYSPDQYSLLLSAWLIDLPPPSVI